VRSRGNIGGIAVIVLSLAVMARADVVLTTWDGTDGNWSDGARWSGGQAPVNTPSRQYDAVVRDGTVTVASDVAVNSLTLSAHSQTNPYAPEITGSGNITTSGLFTWDHGTLSGTGVFNANGGLYLANRVGSEWLLSNYKTINNGGIATWNTGMAILNGGVINNLAMAVFDAVSDSSISDYGGSFNNYGLFRKTAGETELWMGKGSYVTNFSNQSTGVVQVTQGALYFYGGGTSEGSFSAAAGSRVGFRGSETARYTLLPGAMITGAGELYLSSSSVGPTYYQGVDVHGTIDVTGRTVVNGDVAFKSGASLANVGQLEVYGTADFSTGTDKTLAGSHLGGGALVGSDNITFSGTNTWTNARIATIGTQRNEGTVTVAKVSRIESNTFDNAGTFRIADGLQLNNATFNNLTGARFEANVPDWLSNGSTIGQANGTVGTFSNSGTFVTSGSHGLSISTQFNSTGTVNVNTGNSIQFSGGTDIAGDILLNDSVAHLQNGNNFIRPTGTVSGLGLLALTNTEVDGQLRVQGVNNDAGRGIGAGETTNFNNGSVVALTDGIFKVGSHGVGGSGNTVNFDAGATVERMGDRLWVAWGNVVNFNTGQAVGLHDVYVDGTIQGTDALQIGGKVSGSGTIQNDAVAGGVSPGASAGILSFARNLVLGTDADSLFELAGRTRTETSASSQFD
jgi:hypothetical protein